MRLSLFLLPNRLTVSLSRPNARRASRTIDTLTQSASNCAISAKVYSPFDVGFLHPNISFFPPRQGISRTEPAAWHPRQAAGLRNNRILLKQSDTSCCVHEHKKQADCVHRATQNARRITQTVHRARWIQHRQSVAKSVSGVLKTTMQKLKFIAVASALIASIALTGCDQQPAAPATEPAAPAAEAPAPAPAAQPAPDAQTAKPAEGTAPAQTEAAPAQTDAAQPAEKAK